MDKTEMLDQMLRFANELSDQRKQFTNELAEQGKVISEQNKEIKKLNEFILKLAKPTSASRLSPNMPKLLEVNKADYLFWQCSPVQHAFIQLLLAEFSNQDIADRLDTSLSSIKTRFRHLCGRLDIKRRIDLKLNYESIFENADSDKYLASARIDKNWAIKYGQQTFKKAKKEDPYHKIICETRYRGATMT